ncbi:MAG: DUF6377 domain-containing protein, partial [Prevotellaceae bacterium]|nr:DUF6377 domain-containing protein [Prevotellaceae bacterium]
MQKKLTIASCLLLFAPLAFADSQLDSLLEQLSKDIESKAAYDLQKERELHAKKQMLLIPNLQPEQEYSFNSELSEAYKKYTIDSAIFYAGKNLKLAAATGNSGWFYETRLRLSLLYSTAGMYIEAEAILNSISQSKLSNHLLPLYYDAFRHFYRYYAQINGRAEPLAQSAVYRNFLQEMLDKNSIQYKIVYAEQIIFQEDIEFSVTQDPRDVDSVEVLLLKLFGELSPEHRDYALVTFMLGNLYAVKQQPELRQKYLALSAIADIRNSVKDNASLHALALVLYKSDDLDRAYRFMQSAISDMEFCNVRFRV